jgi:hypothetical protein
MLSIKYVSSQTACIHSIAAVTNTKCYIVHKEDKMNCTNIANKPVEMYEFELSTKKGFIETADRIPYYYFLVTVGIYVFIPPVILKIYAQNRTYSTP